MVAGPSLVLAYAALKREGLGFLTGSQQTAQSNGQYLQFPVLTQDPGGAPSGAAWCNVTRGQLRYVDPVTGSVIGFPLNKLADLTDVTIVNPNDGDVLTFDTALGKWVNSPPTLSSSSSSAPATVNGPTAGTVTYSEDVDTVSQQKRVRLFFSGYENDTATNQNINIPTSFKNAPNISSDVTDGLGHILQVSVSISVITIISPDSSNPFNGWLIVDGI